MCERVCVDLKSALKYDDEVDMLMAFVKGQEVRKITFAEGKQMIIKCAPNTDVLFVINCEKAQICYAEPIKFSNEEMANILPILDHWGVERSERNEGEICCFDETEYGDFYLYDGGFKAIFGNKEYIGGDKTD